MLQCFGIYGIVIKHVQITHVMIVFLKAAEHVFLVVRQFGFNKNTEVPYNRLMTDFGKKTDSLGKTFINLSWAKKIKTFGKTFINFPWTNHRCYSKLVKHGSLMLMVKCCCCCIFLPMFIAHQFAHNGCCMRLL